MQSAIHVFYEREKIAEHTINHGIHQDMCLDEHMSPEHLAQKGLSKDEIIFGQIVWGHILHSMLIISSVKKETLPKILNH